MLKDCCDICGEEVISYTDENGKCWDGISFQEAKYRRKICFLTDSWTEYLSVCGSCRAELAKKRRDRDNG